MTLTVIYKVLGAFLWLISGVYVSTEINKLSKARLEQVSAFIELISFVRLNIDCYATPMPDILAECDSKLIERCGGENADKSTLANFFDSSDIILPKDAKKAVGEFCHTVGKGYKDSEIRMCDSYIIRLEKLREELSAKQPGSEKLSLTMCICIFGTLLLLFI